MQKQPTKLSGTEIEFINMGTFSVIINQKGYAMALNSLFNDILTFALIKTNEGMVYYWEQAHNCNDLIKKIFLLYVSVKKLPIVTYLKKMIGVANSDILSQQDFADMFHYLNIYNANLSNYSLKKIHDISTQNAIKELEFFQLLKIPRETNMQNAIMDDFITQLKEYLENIETGYEKLVSDPVNQESIPDRYNTQAKGNCCGTYA